MISEVIRLTVVGGHLEIHCQHSYAHTTPEGSSSLPAILKGSDIAIYSIFFALSLPVASPSACGPFLGANFVDLHRRGYSDYSHTVREGRKRIKPSAEEYEARKKKMIEEMGYRENLKNMALVHPTLCIPTTDLL